MKTSATNRRIRVLMTALREGTLVPRPEFQRRLVWTNRHKERFLNTVLTEYPFPEIYVAAGDVDPETGEGTEMLVDGQQRITTLFQYFTGSEDLQYRDVSPYSDLSDNEKLSFLEYEVVIRDLGRKSIQEIREVFERINSTQYSLNAMEIRNARFDGALKQFSEELSRNEFFSSNNVFRTNDIRRMGDLVFCLSIVISVMAGYFNRDDSIEEFLSKYNDEFMQGEELADNLGEVFRFIDRCRFSSSSRLWRKADLLTLIVELYLVMYQRNERLAARRVGPALKAFYRTVDAVRDDDARDKEASVYYKAALQGTNDRINRVRRGEVLRAVILSSK